MLDLLTADYTFVNERLAKHYGIPNVYGPQFRRVTLPAELDMRRGLLGKGALLTVTSNAGPHLAGRARQVVPADVPRRRAAAIRRRTWTRASRRKTGRHARATSKAPTMRDIMERHHTNPVCASCHKIFEPIGLALENFDAIGAWRTAGRGQSHRRDRRAGRRHEGRRRRRPARGAACSYSDQFVRVVTEKLLTYALGRGVEYDDMPTGARDRARRGSRASTGSRRSCWAS